jgi:MFS transporter, DHA2 family, multidrug resistance protein
MQGKPLGGAERTLITVALAAATFMQALDSSIANVAIPTISGDLGVSATQGTWVITSFSVANAISIPLTGWLARRVGEVKLFVIAVLLFTLASLGCALSNNIGMLIGFRVLQGLVAGPMTPMSQTLLLAIYPPEKKGLALALWSMTTLLAPICGPIFGGWITDTLSWPWIFFINLPIGLLCAYICWNRLRSRETKTVKQRIDGIGLALLVLGVGCLQVMLDQGRELDWFNSPQIIVLTVVAAISLIALVIWELTSDHPIIDLHLFANRNFTIGTLVGGIAFMAYFGIVIILPLWLQTHMGYTATWAGLVMAPTGVLAIILMPFIGRNLHRMDVRKVASLSFLLFAVCSFWRASFNTDVDFAYILGPQWLQGVGTACLFVPLTGLVLSGMRPDQIASASGLSNFIRILCSSFGTSLTTTLWDRRASVHHATLTEHISVYNPVFKDSVNAINNSGAGLYASVEQLITRQAYMMSTVDLFWLFGWIFLSAIPILWLTKPSSKPVPPAALAAAE